MRDSRRFLALNAQSTRVPGWESRPSCVTVGNAICSTSRKLLIGPAWGAAIGLVAASRDGMNNDPFP
jgi:hypothetical protein